MQTIFDRPFHDSHPLTAYKVPARSLLAMAPINVRGVIRATNKAKISYPVIHISAGARKELLVLQVARAMFEISMDSNKQEMMDGAIVRSKDNKHHHVNKQIDRRIENIMAKIETAMDEMADHHTYEWIQKFVRSKLIGILERVADTSIQLEMVAIHLLFTNFCEGGNNFHPSFECFTNADMYFESLDLLRKTNLTEDYESVAWLMAREILIHLKN